jgi:Immunity protein 26
MTKRIRFAVGNVFQIELPDVNFAYGRVYRDASIGIYRQTTRTLNSPPVGSRDFMFHVGMYADILESGKCPIVGRDEFLRRESEWPPPNFIKDIISGEFSIYYKGKIKSASEAECRNLEETAVWDLHHIVARIMSERSERRGVLDSAR